MVCGWRSWVPREKERARTLTLEVLFPMGEEGATLQFATDAPLRITPEDTGPQIQAKAVFCITTVLAGSTPWLWQGEQPVPPLPTVGHQRGV